MPVGCSNLSAWEGGWLEADNSEWSILLRFDRAFSASYDRSSVCRLRPLSPRAAFRLAIAFLAKRKMKRCDRTPKRRGGRKSSSWASDGKARARRRIFHNRRCFLARRDGAQLRLRALALLARLLAALSRESSSLLDFRCDITASVYGKARNSVSLQFALARLTLTAKAGKIIAERR